MLRSWHFTSYSITSMVAWSLLEALYNSNVILANRFCPWWKVKVVFCNVHCRFHPARYRLYTAGRILLRHSVNRCIHYFLVLYTEPGLWCHSISYNKGRSVVTRLCLEKILWEQPKLFRVAGLPSLSTFRQSSPSWGCRPLVLPCTMHRSRVNSCQELSRTYFLRCTYRPSDHPK